MLTKKQGPQPEPGQVWRIDQNWVDLEKGSYEIAADGVGQLFVIVRRCDDNTGKTDRITRVTLTKRFKLVSKKNFISRFLRWVFRKD